MKLWLFLVIAGVIRVLTIISTNFARKDWKDNFKMPQEFQSSVRTYKYPFELIMKVGQCLDHDLE